MRDSETSPPFGMSPMLPAFERATRIAEALFEGAEASVVLVDGEREWRSGGSLVGSDTPAAGSRIVIERGKAIWVGDREADPKIDRQSPHARFWAGAPLRLADGATVGALAVRSHAPRAYDRVLAGRLQDLADGLADECDRARLAEIAEKRDRELRSARALLAAFVGSVPMQSVMTDKDLRVLTATPRWLEALGVAESEAVGRTLEEISAEAFAYFRDHFERCLAGEVVKESQVPVLIDGKPGWMTLELTPWRDEAGEIAGVVSAAHDITATVNAMRSVERTQERLQLAAEMASLEVYDIDYRRRTVVRAGKTLFPLSETREKAFADALFEGKLDHFVDRRDRQRVAETWARFEEERAPYEIEYRIAQKEQAEEFWIAEVTQATRDEKGNIRRIVGAMQDITARKAAERALIEAKEQAEAATRAKSAFLATMSHEIRTPLNGVLGMAQALAAGALEPGQKEQLEVIRQSGEMLLSVLNELLDLSKIEAGRLELEKAEFDIGSLVRSVHVAFAGIAAQKGLQFDLTVTPAAAGLYLGDATRVRQVLNNLISNALKFTDQGRVGVKVATRRGAVTLTVVDTGIGISATQQAALFQRFAQADASTTRRFGGSGLGLAICRQLAELMGGRVEVTSTVGGGSTFVVTLPLQRVERLRPAPDPAATHTPLSAPPAAEGSALRVLAAEDNPMNQLVLRTLLAQFGIDPVVVEDGVDAVAAWEAGDWDVILMDVQMPRMDGPTATRFIRERERTQRRRRTPILALTANTMTHQVKEYIAAGMDDFIAKPIEIRRLLAALEGALAPAAKDGQERRLG